MSTPNAPPLAVPMFSTTGWTASLNEKADALLSHFFEADAFQSNLYMGNISSLQYLIQQYNSDIVKLLSNIRQTLEQYLTRYYPEGVVVQATSNGTDPSFTAGVLDVTITASVTEGGLQYSFGYLVSAENSIISKIARINNSGPAF